MIIRSLEEIDGTERDVEHNTWRSRRLLLARDGVGFSLHETVLYAGTSTSMWYANHVEAVYCIDGEAELVNEDTGERHTITPGMMYVLNGHEHHTLNVKRDFRVMCVFNPPCTGREVHDETGAYPLLVEEPAEVAS